MSWRLGGGDQNNVPCMYSVWSSNHQLRSFPVSHEYGSNISRNPIKLMVVWPARHSWIYAQHQSTPMDTAPKNLRIQADDIPTNAAPTQTCRCPSWAKDLAAWLHRGFLTIKNDISSASPECITSKLELLLNADTIWISSSHLSITISATISYWMILFRIAIFNRGRTFFFPAMDRCQVANHTAPRCTPPVSAFVNVSNCLEIDDKRTI